MANRAIFATATRAPVADTVNRAGGVAYALSTKGALAQFAVTGVFNDTFYASAQTQVDEMAALVAAVQDDAFLAKLALYSREKAYMKDMPAYLCAVLATRNVELLAQVFPRVIDNGKMLRNFVQMVRSGAVGRRSLGTRPKKLVARWLAAANDAQLLAASVGNAPSLADVIRLAHPKAEDAQREAFFRWVLGREAELETLPEAVRALEDFRAGRSLEVPRVPFELLTSLPLSKSDWGVIADNASWTQTRMNLNTFLRHGVFEDRERVRRLAERLRNPEMIAKARVFPYQLLAAYLNAATDVPLQLREALQDAMEVAVDNVPAFEGGVAVLVDTSGSMKSPVTGARAGATTSVRCIDVAGLFASAVVRRNPGATVVPFDTRVHECRMNPRDSVMTNAAYLARFGGGGTNCAVALEELNKRKVTDRLVIYVSDNESWVGRGRYGGTGVMDAWERYRRRVPGAKLVCIDITPNATTQAREAHDILNVGGFSDEVFNIVRRYAREELSPAHWEGEIERVEL